MVIVMKSPIFTAIFASLISSPAIAGPYLNIEANPGFTGTEYDSTTTEIHIGYEDEIGERGSWFIQGGPALYASTDTPLETVFSAKIGGDYLMTDSLLVYGELSILTGDTNNFGSKAGIKWNF